MAQVLAAAPFGDMCNSTVYGGLFSGGPKSRTLPKGGTRKSAATEKNKRLKMLENELREYEARAFGHDAGKKNYNPQLGRLDNEIIIEKLELKISGLQDELESLKQDLRIQEARALPIAQGAVGPLDVLENRIMEKEKTLNNLKDDLEKALQSTTAAAGRRR